jgi:hypothetical protein
MAMDYRSVITASTLVHTGGGRLAAVLVSSKEASPQTITLYDNTAASGTVIFQLYLNPAQAPFYLVFPDGHQPKFSVGLYVVPGATSLQVWAVGN